MGPGYRKESEYCGSSIPMSTRRADPESLQPCYLPKPLQTGGKRTGLVPSTCRVWDHDVPNGNAFHSGPQRALLSVGIVTGLSLLLSSA